VYHVLSEAVEVWEANGHDVRQRPGQKMDKRDATWIAELLAPGLIKPSCVPPPEIRALRDLTRVRVSPVQTRTQAKNWVYKILEDTNIKLASVVSDVFGKRARRPAGEAPSQVGRGVVPLSLVLDRRLRMGEGGASVVLWGDSLGTGDVGRLEGGASNALGRPWSDAHSPGTANATLKFLCEHFKDASAGMTRLMDYASV
jgi:hypothetical protein